MSVTFVRICPVCGSAVLHDSYGDDTVFSNRNWVNDPIKTPLGLASPTDIGLTKVRNLQISEIQTKRGRVEDDLVLYKHITAGDKTVFSSVYPSWETLPNGNLWWKRVPISKIPIQELRASTELCLLHNEISKEDYFNYDYRGFPLARPHQADWTDPDLTDTRKVVRALHIEELRKSNPLSLIEKWLGCNEHFAFYKFQPGTGAAGGQGAYGAYQTVLLTGSNLPYTSYPSIVVIGSTGMYATMNTDYVISDVTFDLTPAGFTAHVHLRLHFDEMMHYVGFTGGSPSYDIWGGNCGYPEMYSSGGFTGNLIAYLPSIIVKDNSILSFDASISGSWYNDEGVLYDTGALSGVFPNIKVSYGGIQLSPGVNDLGALLGEGFIPGGTYGNRRAEFLTLPYKYMQLQPTIYVSTVLCPPISSSPIQYIADAEMTVDITITNFKIINVRKNQGGWYHN